MLIFIEISTQEFDSMREDERRCFFDMFIKASCNGNHRFVVQPGLSDWAYENKSYFLDNEEDLVGAHLADLEDINSYQSYVEPEKPRIHMEIQFNCNPPEFDVTKNKWTIGYKKIIGSNFLEPCQLVVENKNSDGKFYKIIFENVMNLHMPDIEYIYVNSNVISGAGTGVAGKVRFQIENKFMFYCICDSDRLGPNAKCGSTYTGAKRQIEKPNLEFLGVVNCTPCHESENFLCIGLIRKLLEGEKITDKDTVLDYYQERKDSQGKNVVKGDCVWLFTDIKDGIDEKNVTNKSTSANGIKWILKKYDINNLSELNIEEIDDDILKKFIKRNRIDKKFNDCLLEYMRGEYWDKHFSKWFEEIIWYLSGQETSNLTLSE